jgi:hypothetical protein
MDDLTRKELFLVEMQKVHKIVDMLVNKYDLQGQVINVMLTGMLSTDEFDDPVLKAVFSLDVESEDVLDEVFDFLRFSYVFPAEEDVEFDSENWYKEIIDGLNEQDGFDPSCN